MSARSFLLSAIVLAACGKHAADKPKPTADPAKVRDAAKAMADHLPAMAGAPECKDADLAAPVTMTYTTLERVAQMVPQKDPEHADWINPPQLDTPAARVLADPSATVQAAGEAAATLLAAKAWLVYRVDMVNAPIALGVKELKIGTVGTRIVRYDAATRLPTCVRVFTFQNDKAKSDWAIEQSNKVVIDPAVAQAMREDLADRYLKLLPRGPAPAPSPK